MTNSNRSYYGFTVKNSASKNCQEQWYFSCLSWLLKIKSRTLEKGNLVWILKIMHQEKLLVCLESSYYY